MLATILFFCAAVVFGIFTVRALLCLRWAVPLPRISLDSAARPRCSVIIAARDEGDRLAQTLDHILAQEGIDLEVIPVDDRSRDQTPEILRRAAARDARVKPVRVDALPDNWLGKCHACHLGARAASGDWLLFTDADCWLKPDVLAHAVALALREQVQHVTLTPGVAGVNLPARACHLAFLLTVLDWIARVNEDHPNGHLGIGAFNLVHAATYRAFGGHEPLRLSVVDDIKLGKLVRRAGGKTRAFFGSSDVECHWGITLRHFVKIMEKNYFAALDYRTSLGILVGLIMPALWAVCLAGPFFGTFLGWAAALSLASIAGPSVILARRLHWPWIAGLLTPFIFPVLYFAVLNSMVRTLWRGGVRWRDTFYPLDLLRKGNLP